MLKWDPKEYGDIEDIRLPADKLWKPDVLLYNRYTSKMSTYYRSSVMHFLTDLKSLTSPVTSLSRCNVLTRALFFIKVHRL